MLALTGLGAGPMGAAALSLFAPGAPAAQSSLDLLWTALIALVAAPVVEELAFRGFIQDFAHQWFGRLQLNKVGVCGLTCANMATSVLFAACHIPYQAPHLAALVMLPSLMLGKLKELTGLVFPCVLMHAWFNACYLACLGLFNSLFQ
jgi:membrane protease YdiL (CAAX protease family)